MTTDVSTEKPIEQIVSEWQAIEAKRPGGTMPRVAEVLELSRTTRTTSSEDDLLETIRILYTNNQQYHREMGALISTLAQAQARIQALEGALTPSMETKAAYMGEFHFEVRECNPSWGIDDDEPEFLYRRVMVPWDTVKEIMAAISARAVLGGGAE